MRILHTSDWHLGRVLHGASMLGDQAHVLAGLSHLARDQRVDAVVVAGDLYDRSVPPADAVELLDETLSRLLLDTRIPVLVIAGNHDSPERLGFGSRLLSGQGLHVAGPFGASGRVVELRDSAGPVFFHLLPYADPPVLREALADPAVTTHDQGFASFLGRVRPRGRSVLVAHAFVAGGLESPDSERPLSVGGTGTVDVSRFAAFTYTALGHLHRPQQLAGGRVRYSGSLLRYSFDESSHGKSWSIVDLAPDGGVTAQEIPIRPRRELRRLRGRFEELLANAPRDPGREDYLQIELEGMDAYAEPMARLKQVYPNTLNLLRPDLEAAADGARGAGARPDFRRFTDLDLFAMFYRDTQGEDLKESDRAVLEEVFRDVAGQEAAG
jgi:exonuclease SbcD